jgi:outer membrane protein assembly factor BamB
MNFLKWALRAAPLVAACGAPAYSHTHPVPEVSLEKTLTTPFGIRTSPLVLPDGRIVIGTSEGTGTLAFLDADGTLIRQVELAHEPFQTPALLPNGLIAASDDETLYLLDQRGTFLAKHPAHGSIPMAARNGSLISLEYENVRVYDSSGQLLHDVPLPDSRFEWIVLRDDNLAVGGFDRGLSFVNVENGNSASIDKASPAALLELSTGEVFFVAHGDKAYLADRNGQILWKAKLQFPHNSEYTLARSAETASGEILFVDWRGHVYLITRAGDARLAHDIGEELVAGPVVMPDAKIALAFGPNGRIVILSPDGTAVVHESVSGADISSDLQVMGTDTITFGSRHGLIYFWQDFSKEPQAIPLATSDPVWRLPVCQAPGTYVMNAHPGDNHLYFFAGAKRAIAPETSRR